MKKLLALLLVALMTISMVACGEETTSAEPSKTESEATDSITFKLSEAFGTDSVECVITETKWLTSEEFKEYSKRNGESLVLDTELVFPDYRVWGVTGVAESKLADTSFLCVTYSLQNVGKEDVVSEMESAGFGMMDVPYGTIEVIYDDGYTFGFSDGDFGKYQGFTYPLRVLSDPITEVMMINVPNQVFENDDKPLMLKVTLPSSNEEIEEFIVSIR